jgi:pimeloyl-ACP methyl ester carboxylesterase
VSAGSRALKIAGITAGVAAGVAGAAYAAQRAVARSLQHRPDPDAGRLGPLDFEESRRLPSHDGGSIYTVSRGTGPPIVLAHGVTLSSRVWVKQFESLPRAGARVVAFDHRGHGESSVGESGHSVENLGRDLGTVLEGLDLRDAVLVGHSMGGMAVQEFAIRHPGILHERVRGIVLLSTMAKTQLSASRRLRCAVERMSERFTLGSVMARPELGTMFARIGFGREPLASHVELTREMLAACDAETSRDAVNALFGLDLTAELPMLYVPTLVIGGTRDVITPPAESRRIAQLVPGARLVMFEHAGHMLMLERTAELDALVIDFAHDVGAFGTDRAASA